jgi:hypothetical protein
VTHRLPTPEQRFVASRPYYRALVQGGLLRRLIPPPLGGEMTGLVDLAIEAEELMAVETSVPLSVFSTGLGLMPLLFFGTGEQQSRLPHRSCPGTTSRWPASPSASPAEAPTSGSRVPTSASRPWPAGTATSG